MAKLIAAGKAIARLFTASASPATAPAQALHQGQPLFRQIALTFDTEFEPTVTPRLLDVLDANKARSTFFLVGKEIEPYSELAHRVTANHEVGNHTYYHTSMTHISRQDQSLQVRMADEAISKGVGRSPKPFFRPPFGDYDDTVLQVCGEQGYPYVLHWSVAPDETATVAQEVNDLLAQAFPGGIALFHGWTVNTPPALELALPELRRRGYQFVTISEILGIGRGDRDWGETPIYVQPGDTLESLGAAYNTPPAFLGAYNGLAADPAPETVLETPHRDEVIVRLNGTRLAFDVYPRVVSDRVIAPVRGIADRLGATTVWLPDSQQVLIQRGDQHIVFALGSSTALVNGAATPMSAAAQNISGRTLVPLRFLAETLGYAITWDGATRTVTITPN